MTTQLRPGDVATARIIKVDASGLVLTADDAKVLVRRDELSLERHVDPSVAHHVGDELKIFIKKWVPAAAAFAGSIRRILPGWQMAMAEIRRHQIVLATVEQVWASKVRVDLGPVSGRVLREELSLERGLAPSQIVTVGDEIAIAISKWFEDTPWIVGSRRRALPGWPDAIAQFSVGYVYPASVEYASAESARVDLGPISAEVSRSELQGDQDADPRAALGVGQRIHVLLTHRSSNLGTTGHRASIAAAVAHWVKSTADISIGETRKATVAAIGDDGIEVDLGGGVSGDVPRHELAWEDAGHPRDLFSVGDLVDVVVLGKTPETQKVVLSMRDRLIETNIAQLVGLPESETLEFKEALRGRFDPKDRNAISRKILRTIAAFLNTRGGLLLVGVKDKSRDVPGIEDDQGFSAADLGQRIRDAEEFLSRLLNERLRCDTSLADIVTWETLEFRGRHVMAIRCEVSADADWNGAWVHEGKDKMVYYVRRGESTKPLRPEVAAVDLKERAVKAVREEMETTRYNRQTQS